jgi:hypothetical protein
LRADEADPASPFELVRLQEQDRAVFDRALHALAEQDGLAASGKPSNLNEARSGKLCVELLKERSAVEPRPTNIVLDALGVAAG